MNIENVKNKLTKLFVPIYDIFLTDCDNVAGLSTDDFNDDLLKASSYLHDINNITSARARPWTPSATGWMAATDDRLPWLETTFKNPFNVKAIVTQGCSNEDFWVKTYLLEYEIGEDMIKYTNGMSGEPNVSIIYVSCFKRPIIDL